MTRKTPIAARFREEALGADDGKARDAEAYFDMAKDLASEGVESYGRAIELFDEAINMGDLSEPHLMEAHFTRGRLLFRAKEGRYMEYQDNEEALEALTAADELGSRLFGEDRLSPKLIFALAEANRCIGRIHAESNDSQRAADAFEKAIEVARSSSHSESMNVVVDSRLHLAVVQLELRQKEKALATLRALRSTPDLDAERMAIADDFIKELAGAQSEQTPPEAKPAERLSPEVQVAVATRILEEIERIGGREFYGPRAWINFNRTRIVVQIRQAFNPDVPDVGFSVNYPDKRFGEQLDDDGVAFFSLDPTSLLFTTYREDFLRILANADKVKGELQRGEIKHCGDISVGFSKESPSEFVSGDLSVSTRGAGVGFHIYLGREEGSQPFDTTEWIDVTPTRFAEGSYTTLEQHEPNTASLVRRVISDFTKREGIEVAEGDRTALRDAVAALMAESPTRATGAIDAIEDCEGFNQASAQNLADIARNPFGVFYVPQAAAEAGLSDDETKPLQDIVGRINTYFVSRLALVPYKPGERRLYPPSSRTADVYKGMTPENFACRIGFHIWNEGSGVVPEDVQLAGAILSGDYSREGVPYYMQDYASELLPEAAVKQGRAFSLADAFAKWILGREDEIPGQQHPNSRSKVLDFFAGVAASEHISSRFTEITNTLNKIDFQYKATPNISRPNVGILDCTDAKELAILGAHFTEAPLAFLVNTKKEAARFAAGAIVVSLEEYEGNTIAAIGELVNRLTRYIKEKLPNARPKFLLYTTQKLKQIANIEIIPLIERNYTAIAQWLKAMIDTIGIQYPPKDERRLMDAFEAAARAI